MIEWEKNLERGREKEMSEKTSFRGMGDLTRERISGRRNLG